MKLRQALLVLLEHCGPQCKQERWRDLSKALTALHLAVEAHEALERWRSAIDDGSIQQKGDGYDYWQKWSEAEANLRQAENEESLEK
jgi:hypothetical protein